MNTTGFTNSLIVADSGTTTRNGSINTKGDREGVLNDELRVILTDGKIMASLMRSLSAAGAHGLQASAILPPHC